MSLRPTPPHEAELVLAYPTAERTPEFIEAVTRGFYDTYQADLWEPGRALVEPDRNFGFTVDDRWISTAGVYSRELTVPGGAVPVAAVTFVTVSPSYRRRGLLRQMMTHQLADIQRRGTEPVALLWASEAAIYGRFGYGHTGPKLHLSGDTRRSSFRPEIDRGAGSVGEVERDAYLEVAPVLHERWLAQRPGALNRTAPWWTRLVHDPEPWREGASPQRYAVHFDGAGEPDGYLAFRVKGGVDGSEAEARVYDLDAADPAAYAALWRFILDLDLVGSFIRQAGPVDEPLLHLLADERAVRAELSDGTYARLVDVPRALEARRYATELDVVIGVEDALLPDNAGALRLQAGPEGATVTRVRREPDLTVNVRELGAIYLGGVSLTVLHRAGLVVERRPGSVAAVSTAFGADRLPFCPDFF
jgi:predicted acetyltransferase